MLHWKDIAAVVAAVLTTINYASYALQAKRGKFKPHLYSWLLWGSVTLIAFALQVTNGAGIGALVTIATAIMSLAVAIVGLTVNKKDQDITLTDTVFFILAGVSLVIWLYAKQPTLSLIFLTATDVLGFLPTVRKSWNKPFEESVSTYYVCALRYCIALSALQHYSLLTVLYPAAWVVANTSFSTVLFLRRQRLTPHASRFEFEPEIV